MPKPKPSVTRGYAGVCRRPPDAVRAGAYPGGGSDRANAILPFGAQAKRLTGFKHSFGFMLSDAAPPPNQTPPSSAPHENCKKVAPGESSGKPLHRNSLLEVRRETFRGWALVNSILQSCCLLRDSGLVM